MKRDELTISVGETLGGKWLAQVRREEFGLSYPHARTREEAVNWALDTARRELSGPEGEAA